MQVEQPSLIHLMAINYPGSTTNIDWPAGRRETVQVDLSEFEKGRLISSASRGIILKKSEYCLRAFNTRNGTFIGRDELKSDEVRH